MLSEGISQAEVHRWAKSIDPDCDISRSQISRHNANHRVPSQKELTFDPADQGQAPPMPKPSEETVKTAEELANKKLCLSLDKFCDLIINQAIINIAERRLLPNVGDALRAAELKRLLDTGSTQAESLLHLFTSMSENHGLVRKN